MKVAKEPELQQDFYADLVISKCDVLLVEESRGLGEGMESDKRTTSLIKTHTNTPAPDMYIYHN